MKILLSTRGPDPTSEMDPRFGRAQGFQLVDLETGSVTWHENDSGLAAAHGAGTQAAQAVVELGAQAVITGAVGPNAMRVLQAGGVRIFQAPAGSQAAQILERYRAGDLREISQAGEPHVGLGGGGGGGRGRGRY